MMYFRAQNFLDGRTRRKLKANTYFETTHSGRIDVIFHATHIMSIYQDNTVTLNNGGWNTVTTRQRLNQVLGMLYGYDARPRVFTTQGEAFLSEGRRTKIEFFNHMKLNSDGNCVNYWDRG